MKRTSGNTRQGFTLIEVLLVVVIIGILVGVAVPRLAGRVGKAQIARAKADIESIGLALRMYELDNGNYPSSLDDLMRQPGNAANWDGPYLEKAVPQDPWNALYAYQYPGTRNTHGYDLYSAGKDGTPGTDDDITNWQ